MTHVIDELDDIVHQRVRLGLLTVLDELRRADFLYLKDELDLTAGNLSRHLSVLEDAGYIIIDKTIEANRPRTWARITQQGQAALAEHIAALQQLLGLDRPDETTDN